MSVRTEHVFVVGLVVVSAVMSVWTNAESQESNYFVDFTPAAQFQLDITTGGTGFGTTDPVPGLYSFDEGNTVAVKAIPSAGSTFTQWDGDIGGANPSESDIELLMDQDRSLTAIFALNRFLTINALGGGTTLPAEGVYEYPENSFVYIRATPYPGYVFDHWEGDIGDNDPYQPSLNLQMDQDRNITAYFVTADWILTVQASGNGTTEPSPGMYGFLEGDSACVTMRLLAGGDAFSQWSGDLDPYADVSEVQQCFIMDRDRTVTAEFVPGDWTLTLAQAGDGAGTVLPGLGVFSYLDGSYEDIFATPDFGVYFGGWTGDYIGFEQSLHMLMDSNKSLTVTFDTSGYILMVEIEGQGDLNYEPGPHLFSAGAEFTLTPVYTPIGWTFNHWSGDLPSGTDPENPELAVIMDQDRDITAHFSRVMYTLTIILDGEGSTIPAGGPDPGITYTYFWRDMVNVEVEFSTGDQAFSYWSGDTDLGETTNWTLELDMYKNRTIVAHFMPASWYLTIDYTGNGSTYPPPGTYGFSNARVVNIRAILVDGGDAFQQWTGDVPSGMNAQQFTLDLPMNRNRTLSAEFASGDYLLTMNPIVGDGTGQLRPAPGAYAYVTGQTAEIEAQLDTGMFWGGWSGDINTYDFIHEVVMDADKQVTPRITTTGFTLTLNIAGAEGSVSPEGVIPYSAGATPIIHAIENGQGLFDHWSGNLPADADPLNPDLVILMDQDRNITANFVLADWYLYIQAIGNGFTDPPAALYWYRDGESFEVTAYAGVDAAFSHWQGDLPEGQDPEAYTISGIMTSNREVIALFTSNTVLVPDIIGRLLSDAEMVLAFVGLTLGDITEEYSAVVPAGRIISQDPAPETVVAYGRSVDIVVSLGVCYTPVPNLIGLLQADAETAIAAANLLVGAITFEYNDETPAGKVISQDPIYGLIPECGTPVNLVISLGHCYTAVPDLIGLTQTEAEAALSAVGLVLGILTEEYSDTIPEGRIISQNPVVGFAADCGASINLMISLGRCYVLVPDLIGLAPEEAENTLEAAGLVPGTISEAYSDVIPEGMVASQTPVAGFSADCGSTVTFVISLGTAPSEGEGEEGEEGEEGGHEGEEEGTEEGMHTADQDGDFEISLSELLNVIQFYNSDGFHCEEGAEHPYAPGPGDHGCIPHSSDYNPQNWRINVSELLRLIQFFNSGGYHYCPGEGAEDGFCPGL
ncbi:MAG TPA: PASTA domain-containing protein [Candidatus Hydrogenedentes bacterium]|nr:PASTA domain-containing protein [Candidatus Hydrogenedentota bacterium]